jgi:hypothetical protein
MPTGSSEDRYQTTMSRVASIVAEFERDHAAEIDAMSATTGSRCGPMRARSVGAPDRPFGSLTPEDWSSQWQAGSYQ